MKICQPESVRKENETIRICGKDIKVVNNTLKRQDTKRISTILVYGVETLRHMGGGEKICVLDLPLNVCLFFLQEVQSFFLSLFQIFFHFKGFKTV